MLRYLKIYFSGFIMFFIAWVFCTLMLISVDIYGEDDTSGIEHGDIVFSNRIAVKADKLMRGDIVTFMFDDGTGKRLMVRRIVGLPEEEVSIADSRLWINQEEIREDYIMGSMDEGFSVVVPAGQVLTVCDYRSSIDYPAELLSSSDVIGSVFYSFRVPETIKRTELWKMLYS